MTERNYVDEVLRIAKEKRQELQGERVGKGEEKRKRGRGEKRERGEGELLLTTM